MIELAVLAQLMSAGVPIAQSQPAGPAEVRLFQDACIDGKARLANPQRLQLKQLGRRAHRALQRAGMIAFYSSQDRPARAIDDSAAVYFTSLKPQTYLVPAMSVDQRESSRPVCALITKADVFVSAVRQIQGLVRPDKAMPFQQGSTIGTVTDKGTIIAETFEARIGTVSVAIFRENGWTVMRSLDLGDRNYPYQFPVTGKKN